MTLYTVYYGEISDWTFNSLDWANGYIDNHVRKYPNSFKTKAGFSIRKHYKN